MVYETTAMATGNDANDSKNNGGWDRTGNFVRQTRLIRVIIAAVVLIYTINVIVGLDSDNIALIAILSGIAGSAATFLFSSASGRDG